MKLYNSEDIYNFNINEVKNLYNKYVSSSQVKLLSSFGFGNDLSIKSEGCWIYTKKGQKILDFTGGFGVLNHGHNNQRIINARVNFQKQKKVEVHKNFLCPYLAALSHNIAQLLPGDLNISYLPNSGAEANEGAIKLAYKFHGGKRKYILHSDISFHGKLLGTGSISSSPEVKFNFPGLIDKKAFRWNDLEHVKKIISELEIEKNFCDVYAIIIEPFSASSLKECSKEFLFGLREICNKKNILLIFDEIYTGWAKTGELFYFMKYKNLIPDILTMSKSFGGGKSSISCFVTKEKFFNRAYGNLEDSTIHSTTYNAFGEETVTAIEAINIVIEENYQEKAKKIGQFIRSKLEKFQQKYSDQIEEIRGAGCLQGVKFRTGPKFLKNILSMLPLKLTKDERFLSKLVTSSVINYLYDEQKILTALGQNKEIFLWISPPIICEETELNYFFNSFEKALDLGLIKLTIQFLKKQIFSK